MCTRIFWSDNPQAKVIGRTMDWEVSDEPDMWAFPRGVTRDGGVGDNSLTWTSRYGSVALSAWGVAASDGINEHGLASHTLYLEEAVYEPRDERPGVSTLLWSQYFLDNFKTVAEAISSLDQIQIVSAPVHGKHLGLHVTLEDASGDSAIVEYVKGKMVVHHGPQYTVMANDPAYGEQLENLKDYKPFGGELPPPGDITSLHRFVRASYFLHYLPEPTNEAEAVAGVLHITRNVAVPYGAPYDDFSTYPTWWMTVSDVTHRVYYFESTLSPNVIWVELENVDLAEGAPVMKLNPRNPALVGEVSRGFAAAEQPY